MDLGLLRRLVGKRNPRRTRAARVPPPPDGDEIEAAARPRRTFAREAAHAMPRGDDDDDDDGSDPLMGEDQDDYDDDDPAGQMDLLMFYKDKVEEIQDKAGDVDHAPVSGNLYSYMALRDFGEATELFQSKGTKTLTAGLYFVIIIQIIGPVLILFYSAYSLAPNGDNGHPPWGLGGWTYVPGSRKQGISNFGKRLLGILFIVLFALNGAYTMDKEARNMEKILDMCHVFKAVARKSRTLGFSEFKKTPPEPKQKWLWFGAIVNAWCLILCTLSIPMIMLLSENPKDVLFDALGLTFLYNLDDIGGDLGLLDDEWDADQFGDLFGALADQTAQDDNKQGALLEDIRKRREDHFTANDFLAKCRYLMLGLMVILPIAYMFSNYEERDSIEEDMIADLSAQVQQLQQQLATISR